MYTLFLLSAFAAEPDCGKSTTDVQIDGATGIVYVLQSSGRWTRAVDGVVEVAYTDATREPVTVNIDLVAPSDPRATPVVPDIIIRPKPDCPPSP